MIDIAIYKQLHLHTTAIQKTDDPISTATNFPKYPFLLLLPSSLPGFNMRYKRWENLDVERFADVAWDTRAFDGLVLPEMRKSLLQALVLNQVGSSKDSKTVSEKYKGLVILLHGAPGTGKTFTAESVAEAAMRPLYRVNCDDIGTGPESAEKYLSSVFELSSRWGCILLLDEADVFLEERSLENLQRNALVSVFLRALEYFSGILFLTSSRVGTIDEAFRTRIQLALHYSNPTREQRRLIWTGYLNKLKGHDKEEPNIDLSDVTSNLDRLAEYPMNARQIRNTITTANQLRSFHRRELRFSDLETVISVAGAFDQYLQTVHGGISDEELARNRGIR